MVRKIHLIVLGLFLNSYLIYCQTDQLVIKVPASERGGLISFENPKGSIKVTGYDGDVILVTGTFRIKEQEGENTQGMRRISQNLIDITAEVTGNSVIVKTSSTGKTIDFDIKIPSDFSVKLKSLDNGKIEVINVRGEIEAENSNGDISLENVWGSAVVNSVYGKITATFREVKSNSPMMFSSFEGDIDLTFPPTINAVMKMKTDKGEILSDFDIKPLARQPVIKNVENKQVYSLEKWVTGSVNEGGQEYIISTYTGNILLRKRKGL